MSLVLHVKIKRICLKMNDYGRLQTLIICLDQLLTSKIHKKINLRNKIAIFIFILQSS